MPAAIHTFTIKHTHTHTVFCTGCAESVSVIVSLKLTELCVDCVLMRVFRVCVLTVQVSGSCCGAQAGGTEVYKRPGAERPPSDYTHTPISTHTHTHPQSSRHEPRAANGAEGAESVEHHRVRGGTLSGKELSVHHGVSEHPGPGLLEDPLH